MIYLYFKILFGLLLVIDAKALTNNFKCLATLPHLSVGDMNLTESNFQRMLNKHNILAIAVTATWFSGSCKYESFWKELKDDILSRSNIPLARIDYNGGKWLPEYVKIERVPLILFSKNKNLYHYNSILDKNRLQNYLEKMIKPLIKLSTLEEAEQFFEQEKIDSQGRPIRSVKVLGIFNDLEEMESEFNDFKEAANQFVEMPEIYFSILLSPDEIKKAKRKYQDDWFEDYSSSTVVIQRAKGLYTKIELSDLYSYTLLETLKFKALPLVQEYNLKNHEQYQKTNLPMLVGVVDSANDPDLFAQFILTLEQVAANYTETVHFTWVDGIFNKNKKKMLGIEHDKLPTLAFNLILDPKNNTLAYPEEWEISRDKISQFVNDYITYSLYDLKIIYGKDKKVEKNSIYTLFTHVQEYGSNNMTTIFNKRKKSDFVLLIFNSQLIRKFIFLQPFARNFNHIAKRFQQLQIRRVEFGVYDTFYFGLPDEFFHLKPPCFVIIPANQRKKPITVPIDVSIIEFMELIQRRASFNFYLPEYPYIPEESLAKFYSDLIEKGIEPDIDSFVTP